MLANGELLSQSPSLSYLRRTAQWPLGSWMSVEFALRVLVGTSEGRAAVLGFMMLHPQVEA